MDGHTRRIGEVEKLPRQSNFDIFTIYDEIGDAKYWPKQLLEEMLSMVENAYKAVEKYKKRFETWKQKKGARVKCIPTIAEWMKKDKEPP